MARKKGVPQRPGGRTREEELKAKEEEERSAALERLDEELERRAKGAANGGEHVERDGRELAPSPAHAGSSPSPALDGPLEPLPQVLYSTNHKLPPLIPSLRRPPVIPHPDALPHLPSVIPSVANLPPSLLRPLPPTNGAAPSNGHPPPSSKPDLQPPGLSRFAERYVPLWLRNVNADQPLVVVPRSLSEAFTIDYSALQDALFSRQILSHLVDIEAKNVQRIAQAFHTSRQNLPAGASPTSFIPALTPTSYALHHIPLLAAEYQARNLQLQQAALYAVPLRPVARHPSEPPGPSNFVLEAKSIREGWPPVDLGDVLTMRQLRPAYQSWQGFVFQASIVGINRAAGEVVLRCDGMAGAQESMIFNVTWKVQDRVFDVWRRTVEILDLHLTSDMLVSGSSPSTPTTDVAPRPRRRAAVESWLFPQQEDVMDHLPDPEVEQEKWVDSSLNEEQRNAVRSMLWGQHRLPLLLHGPPGTGKTKTLVEGVLQILKKHPHAHILLCGASNPSTDTLALRLRSHMNPKSLFRLNSPSRPFAEVRPELLPFCEVAGEKFGLPSTSELLQKRVICCTLLDASLLLNARVTNHDLSTLEIFVQESIHPSYSITGELALARPHFSYLLVDEAAQATEVDIGAALAVVATDDTRCRRAHVTICGDTKQLGPLVNSEEARAHDFDVSLLERLMSRPVYAEHPGARKNMRRGKAAVGWSVRTTPFVNLLRNYRSTPELLWLPSCEFYHDTLIPSASSSIQTSPLRFYSALPNPGFPLLFQHVSGTDLEIDEGASFYNEAEVAAVREHVVALVRPKEGSRHGVVKPKEISVISPFREQVWRIRLALRAVGLGEVDVGNVEALQGAENRVVIISPVRSKELRWLPIDRAQNRGLLFEPKRFNVAMTRAKELLIVVGNAETLTRDPYFLSFYRLMLRNKAYLGPPISHPGASELGHSVSKLEYEHSRQQQGRENGNGNGNGRQNGHEETYDGGEEEGKEEGDDDHEATQRARDFELLVGRLAGQLVNEAEEDEDFPSLSASTATLGTGRRR